MKNAVLQSFLAGEVIASNMALSTVCCWMVGTRHPKSVNDGIALDHPFVPTLADQSDPKYTPRGPNTENTKEPQCQTQRGLTSQQRGLTQH